MAIRACRGQRRAAYRGSVQRGRPSSWSGFRNVPRFASFLPSILPEDLILSVAWTLKYLLASQTAPKGLGERAPVAEKNGAVQSRSPCEGENGERNHGALVLEFLWFRGPRFCCDADMLLLMKFQQHGIFTWSEKGSSAGTRLTLNIHMQARTE